MSNQVKTKIKKCLDSTRKCGERDYFQEYEITPFQIKMILLQAGFPDDLHDMLDGYCIDLAAMSVYRHKLGSSDVPVPFISCLKVFTGGAKKGTITDVAWNQTIDEIIDAIH